MDYKEKYEQALERARQFSEKPYLEDSAGIVEYIFPELKESEDEKIRKALKQYFVNSFQNNGVAAICGVHVKDVLAYLEKQEQHKKFRDSIQVGDKVTKNEDGVLVNLSQLKRVAKKDENQGEQKPAWSEEDEEELSDAIFFVREYQIPTRNKKLLEAAKKAEEWLKSLKPPYYCDNCKIKKSIQGWKPREEQLDALERVVSERQSLALESLYEDIRKLKY